MSEYDEVDNMPSEMDTLEENRKEYWNGKEKFYLGDADEIEKHREEYWNSREKYYLGNPAEIEKNRKEYWISRRKYFLGDADKANIEKLDMIIAEIKSIKKSIGGI